MDRFQLPPTELVAKVIMCGTLARLKGVDSSGGFVVIDINLGHGQASQHTPRSDGYWTTCRYANSRSGRRVDWTSCGLVNSRSRQLAYWTSRGLDNSRMPPVTLRAEFSFFWRHLRDHELSSPRDVRSASWQSASWRIRELSSYRSDYVCGLAFCQCCEVW